MCLNTFEQKTTYNIYLQKNTESVPLLFQGLLYTLQILSEKQELVAQYCYFPTSNHDLRKYVLANNSHTSNINFFVVGIHYTSRIPLFV